MYFRPSHRFFLLACVLAACSLGLPARSAPSSSAVFQTLELQLVGVVQSEDARPRALIAGGLVGETLIAEGDLVGGYTVASIGEEAVEFAKGSEREMLALKGARVTRPESVKSPLLAFSQAEGPASPPEKTGAGVEFLDLEQADKIIRAGNVKKRLAIQEIPRFHMPMRVGIVSSPFGLRRRPQAASGLLGSERHAGIDIAAPYRTFVYASAPGTVVAVGRSIFQGRYVIIRHVGGYETRYFHLYSQSVKEGDAVEAGQRIGAEGNTGISTGPHLHLEIRKNGIALDPAIFIPSLRKR